MILHIAALVVLIVAGLQPGSTLAQGDREVTVRGCVERDAAARTPVYKLVTSERIYRLAPAGKVDLAGAIGHTVDATGTVAMRETTRGRDEAVLSVTALKSVANRCS
jgi:hypothetical protein